MIELKNVFESGANRRLNYPDLLYANDFPGWFVARLTQERWNWIAIILSLREGSFFYRTDSYGYPTSILPDLVNLGVDDARRLGEHYIRGLAAYACTLPKSESLRRSLGLCGFEVDEENLRLVPIEGPVSVKQEEDRITNLVNTSGLANAQTIVKHLADAQSLYIETGKDHASLNESRSFVQALIDDISEATHTNGGHSTKLPGTMKNRVQYLTDVGFLTTDEQAAYNSAWGSLSAGSHPGVPERDQTRIGLILALEFGQILLLKFANWKKNGYKKFSK
jgi:hypothetical protein